MPSLKICFIVCLFITPLLSQDLERAWQAYNTTNTQISELQNQRGKYAEEQRNLKSGINKLQNGSSWYNTWIYKILLSNQSNRQLVVLDSLERIESQLSRLGIQQNKEFLELKRVYEQLLSSYGKEEDLPLDQRATSLQVGRIMLAQSSPEIQLPDYWELVNGDYENQELRLLVLTDLKKVLTSKLIQLDSLLSIKVSENELALRLADFHEDLGLQMQSDQDVQQRDGSGESVASLNSWYAADALLDQGAAASPEGLTDRYSDAAQSVSLNVTREGLQPIGATVNPGNDLDYLKAKRLEYERIISQLQEELYHTP